MTELVSTIVIALVTAVGGFIMRLLNKQVQVVEKALEESKAKIEALNRELTAVKVDYATKLELKEMTHQFDKRFDRIEDILLKRVS